MQNRSNFRTAVLVGMALVVLAGGYLWYRRDDTTAPAPAPAVMRVQTLVIQPTAVPDIIDTFGTVISRQTVEILPQTGGVITAVHIRDGARVRRGQLLFSIDPRPLRAALAEAQGTLTRDAALASDAADTAQRYAPLATRGAVDAKTAITARNTARSLAGTVALDRAQLRAARLSLAYTEVRSPIDGRAGAVQVKAGNVVAAGGSTPLVMLNVGRGAEASFALALPQVATVRAAQAQRGTLAVQAIDPASQRAIARGTLYFVDNAYDTSSGTLTLRARFANGDGALVPGQFVTVRTILSDGDGSLAVPESALQQGQAGSYVYCLVSGHAVVRQLRIARFLDGQAVVAQGLRPGDVVICTVPNALRAGDAVQSVDPRGTTAPASSAR